MPAVLTAALADRFARIALGHVTREYPNKPGHVLTAADDISTPRALHPLFYGSFDWHSCVHGYWLLARIRRRFPGDPVAAEIERLFDRQITAATVAGECAHFAAPAARGYQRPYGWAWLLKLAAELAPTRWGATLAPLAAIIAERLRTFLPIATSPVRTGSHGNTAFALRLAADYPDAGLDALLQATAARWYAADTDCPAWDEPNGDDFLSATLVEAECMRRLQPATFPAWLDSFLPDLAARRPATLFHPVVASDRSDGKIAHLDGLNLSRAWCFRAIAGALGGADARAGVLHEAADRHLQAGMPHLDSHYMGEHWLATYALLALDETATETIAA